MINSEKSIFVYENWSAPLPRLMGTLHFDSIRGEDLFLFEYSQSFLERFREGYTLDPDLSFYNGRHYPSKSKKLFGIFLILALIDGEGDLCSEGKPLKQVVKEENLEG